jgi:hypothetical protein
LALASAWASRVWVRVEERVTRLVDCSALSMLGHYKGSLA